MEHEKKKFNLLKWVPLMSLIIALCAITFQITVLYPWHLELSAEFAALAKKIASK